MSRYWAIAPVESKPLELFDRVWEYDLTNGFISIGWNQLGDVSAMSREQLGKQIDVTYLEKPAQTRSLIGNMIWAFYHEILPGDYIVARKGRKILAGIGKVKSRAYYSEGKNPHHGHANIIEVDWQDNPRNIAYDSIVFQMYTLSEITDSQFRVFNAGQIEVISPIMKAETKSEDVKEFVLEKYLEDFIVSNFAAIFKSKLTLFVDDEGNEGQQYSTDIGPIDILAIQTNGSFVVIELKKGRPSDQVVGQVLRYMGWVKRHLCHSGQSVQGLVICREPDQKLDYALEMTQGIEVKYYSVNFELRDRSS